MGKQYDNILSCISDVLKNSQALENIMDDFDDTVGKLERTVPIGEVLSELCEEVFYI